MLYIYYNMEQHNVYKIYDDQKIYIGSTKGSIARRKASHHEDFKNLNKTAPLFIYWRSVGWDNMKMESIDGDILTKLERRIKEQEYINEVPKEKSLNHLSAYVRNHECKRSINEPECDMPKVEMKRKNRRDYYSKKKEDEEWMKKERERNKIRMREKRTHLKQLAQETASTTSRVHTGEELSTPQ